MERLSLWKVAVSLAVGALVTLTTPLDLNAGPRSDKRKLKRIVLRESEVPARFREVSSRAYTPEEIAAQGTYSRAQLRRWGYIGGYEREFNRLDENDPAQISSDAGAYRSRTGARSSLAQNTSNCQRSGWRLLRRNVGLGDQSRLCTLLTSVRGRNARVYFVVWRKRRFKSAVTYTALPGRVEPRGVIRLARRQARRM